MEHSMQKGFTPGLSGVFEHTPQMAYLLNKARSKQEAIVITLIDLKNAFGEVHHNQNNFYHIPGHITGLIKSLYDDFSTSVIAPEFRTPFIKVEREYYKGIVYPHYYSIYA